MRTVLITALAGTLAVAILTIRPIEEPASALEWRPSPDLAHTSAQIADAIANLPTTTTTLPAEPGTPRAPVRVIPVDGNVWDALAVCETGGDWATNTGNGYGGGLQFAHTPSWSTWRSFGGLEYAEHPWEATRDQQIAVAERVLASSGWGAWPGCARRLGLR